VSNFTVKQLEELLADTQTVPAVNQVEFHPYLYQRELLEFCTSKGAALLLCYARARVQVWPSSLTQ
jgi:diketogulonate reductase-like aldo/keto reductase